VTSSLNLALFTLPTCGICKEALRGLATVVGHYPLTAVVVDGAGPDESGPLRRLLPKEIVLVSSPKLQSEIGITTIPYAIVTNEDGVVIGKSVVNHVDDLDNLLEYAEAHGAPAAV
jgi:hypothetical protein